MLMVALYTLQQHSNYNTNTVPGTIRSIVTYCTTHVYMRTFIYMPRASDADLGASDTCVHSVTVVFQI